LRYASGGSDDVQQHKDKEKSVSMRSKNRHTCIHDKIIISDWIQHSK